MAAPNLVDATDLGLWARRRESQEKLPKLVRRLILATTKDLRRFNMPAGEGVQSAGWDGVVETASGYSPYVPAGVSVWEMGTNSKVKPKADGDYDKRSSEGESDEDGIVPSRTTFVFVTPRRWPGKQRWARDKRATEQWLDVLVWDADDLETWLESVPSVHSWISEEFGKGGGLGQTLDAYWAAWSEATDPPVSAELVTAGRQDSVKKVVERLLQSPDLLVVRAGSAEEAIAFTAASILLQDDPERESVLSRSLVIHDANAWAHAAASESPLILIPTFNEFDVAAASRGGHFVVVSVGRDAVPSGAVEIQLPRLGRAEDALRTMGLSESRSRDLSRVARQSLLALRRSLSRSPTMKRPPWAQSPVASSLVFALLTGSWDEARPSDRDVISRLANRPYEEVSRFLTDLVNEPDLPVRRVGTTWYLAAREDAWRLLASFITPDDVSRFEELAVMVLTERNPAVDLPSDERFMSAVLGRQPAHSEMLRKGIADMLALMHTPTGSGEAGSRMATPRVSERIAARILSHAKNDSTGDLWFSVTDVLPLLAEAAPDEFLRAIDEALTTTREAILRLFPEPDLSASPFGPTPWVGLLWALETVAWSPTYLASAALILARLAGLTPSLTNTDSPMRSLHNIFVLWDLHTSAPADRRLAVLDTLRRREPVVAWRLLLGLIPAPGEAALPTRMSQWRDWGRDEEIRITRSELRLAIGAVADRLVADVGSDPQRWTELLSIVERIPDESRDEVISALMAIGGGLLERDARLGIWSAIRGLLSHHLRFRGADWALPEETLQRLADAYGRLTPADLIDRLAWLFSHDPQLLRNDDEFTEDYQEAVADSRRDAVTNVTSSLGTDGLHSLIAASENPWEIGWTAGTADLGVVGSDPAFIDMLADPDIGRRNAARGYMVSRFRGDGWEWAEAVLLESTGSWNPSQASDFLICLPTSSRTWTWVQGIGPEAENEYWSTVPVFRLEDSQDLATAAQHLVRYGRPNDAVILLQHNSQYIVHPADFEFTANTLEQLVVLPLHDSRQIQHLSFAVAKLLDHLTDSNLIDHDRLARLEWQYLFLTEHARRPRALYAKLARDPSFFVDVVCLLCKPEHGEPREATPDAIARAQQAYRLLDSWDEVPGQQPNGSIAGPVLAGWVSTARELSASQDRKTMGDIYIGQVLASARSAGGGDWPPEPIRDVIDDVKSDKLDKGFVVGVGNRRGVTSRGLTDGGLQERELSKRYRALAELMVDRWPRTAQVVRRLAGTFDLEAMREDEGAIRWEDLE